MWTSTDLQNSPAADDSSGSGSNTDKWTEVMPYCEDMMIEDVTCLDKHVIIEGRQDGLTQLWAMKKNPVTGKPIASSVSQLSFPEELYEVSLSLSYSLSLSLSLSLTHTYTIPFSSIYSFILRSLTYIYRLVLVLIMFFQLNIYVLLMVLSLPLQPNMIIISERVRDRRRSG